MQKLIVTSKQPAFSGWRRLLPDFNSHRVRLTSGRFQNWRRLTTWPLLALCFITPWLTWQGEPMVHFDIAEKQFRIASQILWPEDLVLLTWVLMAAAFGLFTVSMLAGRLWCGYSCPQTVWTFLFLRLEEWIEGSRHKRMRMDRQKWGVEKALRRGLKHASWLALSLLTGVTFVAYFYPLAHMVADWQNGLPLMAWFWILLFTGFTYMNAGFLREKVCTHMCPYSRFQSVMSDESTVVVHYDVDRGEPRGHKDKAAGDCVDCNLCVQVCPTDIDIRDGLQLACIACGACIDACDSIMEKVGQEKALISYRPTERTNKEIMPTIKRPRLLGYAAIFLLSLSLGINEWINRETIGTSLIRDRNQLYSINANDQIENDFILKLHNKTTQQLTLIVSLKENTDSIQLSKQSFTLPAQQRQQHPLTLSSSQLAGLRDKELILQFKNQQTGVTVAELETSFLAPHQLSAR